MEKIKELICQGEYLIILDGLEEMQKEKQGEEFGKMQHPELKEILTGIAEANYRGLCLITTRFPMTDVGTYPGCNKLEIEELSKDDTRLLFERIEVVGSQNEIDCLREEFAGHTLSLFLLANYLGKGGDIKKAKEIPPFYSDKEAGSKAHRILLWYDRQLDENQRQFMKIFSIFRQAVGENEFEAIFRPKIKMESFHFNQMVKDLEKRRLITKGDNAHTTHPLIKGYFESTFDEMDKKLCHKRLYQYFGEIAPDEPKTLNEMQLLFEQIYHGCRAGVYQEALDDVYWQKVQRGGERFLVSKLGAWETNLSLVQNFFEDGDFQKEPLVTKIRDKSYFINEAGLSMMNLGRLKEAEGLYKKKIDINISQRDWKNASMGYQNLAELQIRTGNLLEAKENSGEAIRLSREVRNVGYECDSTAFLAYTLFLLGDMDKAGIEFEKANELERRYDPSKRYLYSNRGVFYADFLLSQGKIQGALDVTNENLRICERNNWINSINLCHRSLGRIERIKGNHQEAEVHLQKALEIAREAGMPYLEIEALLESGRLHLGRSGFQSRQKEVDFGKSTYYKDAIRDTNHVLKLFDRTGFKLYNPDAELILSRAYLAQNDTSQAKSFAQSAHTKANSMHYHRPKIEAAELLRKLPDLF